MSFAAVFIITILSCVVAGFAQQTVAAGYTYAFASPDRRIAMYTLDANPQYSPSRVPRSIYVFRTSNSLDATRVANQPDVLADEADIRQFVIVVVPSGTLPAPLLTEADVLSSSFQRITVGGTFCHCPLTPGNFTFASPLDRDSYPVRNAVFSNGTVASYIDFGRTSTSGAGTLYAMRSSSTSGELLGYLLDSVPGDVNYSPMRKVISVTVPRTVTNVAALSSAPQVDTGLFVSAAVVFVMGADVTPDVFERQTGFVAGNQVGFVEFNASRLTTSMVSSNGVLPARLYVVAGFSTPVVDVAPGDAGYSDLWSVFDVPATALVVAGATPQSVAAFDVSTARYRGQYINCPMVHPNSTFTDTQAAALIPKLTVFYKGEHRFCFRFPDTPALNCKLREVFELRRGGTGEVVSGNDLFPAGPSDALSYSPMSWVLPLTVTQQYASGSIRTLDEFPGRADVSRSLGYFSNRPIIDEAQASSSITGYAHSVTLHNQEYTRVVLDWTLSAEVLHVRVTASFAAGYVAVGFGGVMGRSHSGYFVVGHISAGQQCVRQFIGSAAGPSGVLEVAENPVNVTAARFSLTQKTAVFAFTRNVVATGIAASGGVTANASLVVNDLTRVTYAVGRTEIATCFTSAAGMLHDAVAGEASILWNRQLVTQGPLTPAPPTFFNPNAPTVAPVVSTLPPNASGTGTYRCDPMMSFSWTINANTAEIEFLITTRTTFSGWVGIGIGSQMGGADIVTLYRHPATGTVVVDDRKGIAYELPPRDLSQDAFLVGDGTQLRFRRKLDTKDLNTGAQPLPRSTLVSRSYIHRLGWANGARVGFYDFRNEPTFGGANTTSVATIWVMRNASGGALRFQRDIIDVVPGQAGYSDLWNVMDVEVPANFIGPEVRSLRDLPSTWRIVETGQRINCPVVHAFSTIDLKGVSLASRELWYRGSIQQCISFGALNAQSTMTQNVYFMRDATTNATVDVVFQHSLVSPDFTPFAWVFHVDVPTGYLAGSYTSEAQVLASPFTPVVQRLHLNLPMVSLNDVTDPIATQTPSPPTLDSALLAQYEKSKVLYTDTAGSERVVLHWNYITSRRVLQVMVIGYAIKGYIAIGFSNATSTQMENADIVLGYVNSRTQEGCVRTMYSAYSTGAPSAPPTLQIRTPSVVATAGAVILRFERDFDGSAHYAGLIPTPAQGATSRVIYATLRGYLDENCSSTSYGALYHSASPHGSVTVEWSAAAAPTTPAPTPSPPFILTRETIPRTIFYYRGLQINGYCAGENFGSNMVAAIPPLYTFVRNISGVLVPAAGQMDIIDDFPRASARYSGLWNVRTLLLPPNVTANLTHADIVMSLNLAEVAPIFTRSCPVVHPETSVQFDASIFPTTPVMYRGQAIACINMGTVTTTTGTSGAGVAAVPMWNTSTSTIPIIDELTAKLWSIVNVQTPSITTIYNAAETIASLLQTTTSHMRLCAMLPAQPSLVGAVTTPAAATLRLQSGFFNGRTVSYVKMPAAQRFASKTTVQTNNVYVLRAGGTAFNAPIAQSEPIVDVAPGNGTYSDVWRVVVVDVVTSRPVGAKLTSWASISSFNMNVTDMFLNCPVINPTTTFTDVVVDRVTMFYRGVNLTCINFGFVPPPPPQIPDVYEIRRTSGVIAANDVFQTVPGSAGFYPLQWVQIAQLSSDASSSLTSEASLNAVQQVRYAAYQLWNIFVVSVSTGARTLALGSVELSGATIIRRGTDALMSAPVSRNITAWPAVTLPPLPIVYVFRRGLTLESEEIEQQAAVIDAAPGEIGYSAATGSSGYADTKIVHIVQVPRNYSGAEIRSFTALSATLGIGWAINTTSNVLMHSFVNVNTTSTADGVNCPAVTMWYRSIAMPSLDCGFSRFVSAVQLRLDSESFGGVVSRDSVGFALATVVPVSQRNPYVINAFRPEVVDAWAAERSVKAFRLSLVGPAPPLTRKFVIRNGPSLFSGKGVDVLLPVLEGSTQVGLPTTMHVHVVDVSGTAAASIPNRIASAAELLAHAESHCWPIHATGVVEVGVLLASQTSVPAIDGAAVVTVQRDGVRLRHVISSRLGVGEVSDAANVIVAVAAAAQPATVVRYVYPDLSRVTWNSLMRVKHLVVGNPASIRSVPTDATLNDTAEVVVIHASEIASRPFVTEPMQQAMLRSEGWYEARKVFFYEFTDRSTPSESAANAPAPLYTFRIIDSRGTSLGSTGSPLIFALPGHADYNDIHAIFTCDVPSTFTGLLPSSERELTLALSRGHVTQCSFSGSTRLTPVVHRLTTIEVVDLFDANVNPTGATRMSVRFEGREFAALDFGTVSAPFSAGTSQALHVRNEAGQTLASNTALARIPGVTGFSPLMQTFTATVPSTYNLNAERNISTIIARSISVTPGAIRTFAVVAIDSLVPQILYDDYPIEQGAIDVIWAYGPLQSYPVELMQHQGRGAAKINFFTGETDEAADAVANRTSENSIQFGTVFSMSWKLQRSQQANPAASSARRFIAEETVTYAPSETEIVITITCLLDGWAGIGISRSGGMSGADIMLAYRTQFVPPGQATLQSYFHLSDRKAGTDYSTPAVDARQDLRLISQRMLDGSGYEVVFARNLITGDPDDFDIADEDITLIWAFGPFDRVVNSPRQHTTQGKLTVNLVTGKAVPVPQQRDSAWYIATLVAVLCVSMLASMMLRVLPPGRILWQKLLKSKAGDTIGWLTGMPIGEHFLLLVACGLGAMWMAGKFFDFRDNRLSDPVWRCLGAGVQFFMYFFLVPSLRNNVILDTFRTYFHRMQHWTNILGVLAVTLAWVHGIGMMITNTTKAFEWHGISAIIGTVCMTGLVMSNASVAPLPARARHVLFWLLVLLTVIFVCIHAPATAYGLVPSFLLMLYDFALRLKDRNSRYAHVRSQATFGSNTLAVELEVYSPWHKCRTRPFQALPGQFVFVHFALTPHPLPLMISSRVLQDVESDWATFTLHMKTGKRSGLVGRLLRDAKEGRLDKRGATIEGPYGGITLRLKFYNTLVLVAGGIGMTSIMSILELLTFDAEFFSRETQLKHVVVVWVVHQAEELLVFANELQEIMRTPRPFELELMLFATALSRNPLPPFIGEETEGLPQRYADANADLPSHTLFSKQPVLRGRPVLPKIFADLKLAIAKRLEFRAAVYVSAPESLAADVDEVCAELSNWKEFQFHVEREAYAFR